MRAPTVATARVIALARRSPSAPPLLVALGHPSLGGAVDRFVDEYADVELAMRLDRPALFGTVALEHGSVTGIAHVEPCGAITLAVSPESDGRATSTALLEHTLRRGRDLGLRRFRLHPDRRGRALRRLARLLGLVVVDVGPGEVEILVMPGSVSHSA